MKRKSPLHIFQFVLRQGMKDELKRLADARGFKSPGRLLSFMIDKAFFYVYHLYLCDKNKRSHLVYPRVYADTVMFAKIDYAVYEKIKKLHGRENTFSMALVVRDVIRLFFWGTGKFGFGGFLVWLKKRREEFEKDTIAMMDFFRRIYRQHMCLNNVTKFVQIICILTKKRE